MATFRQILRTIVGQKIGLEDGGALILNLRNGKQVVLDQNTAQLATDPLTGGVDGFTGPTGQTLKYALQNGSQLVAALGDSISQYAMQGGVNANYLGYNSWGFLTWAMGLSMGALWMPLVGTYNSATALVNYNRGVSGETSSQTYGRLAELDALPVKPRFCSVLTGTNDLTTYAPTLTAAQIVSLVMGNLQSIVAGVKSRGITPVLCTLLPRGNGTSAGWGSLTSGQISTARGALMEINRQIRSFCQNNANVILADTFYSINNWASATSDPVAGYTGAGIGAADYLHPNTPGSLLVGNVWWKAVSPFVNPAPRQMAGGGDLYDSTNNPYGSVIDSSFAASGGTQGAGTGTVPNGFTINRLSGSTSAMVSAQQARSDGSTGYEVAQVMTGLDATTFRMYSGGSSLTDFAVGDAIYFESEATFNAGSAIYYGPDNFIRSTGGAIGWSMSAAQNPAGIGGSMPSGSYSVLLRTPIGISGPTQTSWNAWTQDAVNSGGSGTSSSTRRNLRIARYNRAGVGSVTF